MKKIVPVIVFVCALTLVVSFLMAFSEVFAETTELAVKVDGVEGGTATVRLFSTEELNTETEYHLYTIVKVNGRWEKEMYIRSIYFPPAERKRKGKKYKYCSKQYEVEKLARGHVYALIPLRENDHCSKPFWRKPVR